MSRRKRLQHDITCAAPGAWVRTSPSFESQVTCNRVSGHDGPHRLVNGATFAVIAEWDEISERAERTKRKIRT